MLGLGCYYNISDSIELCIVELTLVMLNSAMNYTPPQFFILLAHSIPVVNICFKSEWENSVDTEQMPSLEASQSGSTVFSKKEKFMFV